MISGVKALFLNWKPFTVLTLGLMALLVPVALAVALLYQFAGTSGGFSVVLFGLIMLIALAFQLAIFGTQFCSFRDIYGLESDGTGLNPQEVNDHQLLA